MPTDPNCIFCKIVAGEIPSFKLFEDDRVLSFMDVNPFNEGHCLVITKEHYENLFAAPDADLGAAVAAAKRVAAAVEKAIAPDGINLIQANGPGAGQTVFHFHFHIFPRRLDDNAQLNWGHNPGDMTQIEATAARIREAMS